MKIVYTIIFMMVISTQCYPATGKVTGNFNVMIGQKDIEKDDWEPVHEQDLLGFQLDIAENGWPVNVTVGYLKTDDEEKISYINLEGETTEIFVGVRKYFGNEVAPYIEGGLSLITADAKASAYDYDISISDSDNSIGPFLGGGLLFQLGNVLNLGVGIKYSVASVTIFDEDVDAGGMSYFVMAGFHW